MKKILITKEVLSAYAYYRALLPSIHLKSEDWEITVGEFCLSTNIDEYDAFMFYGAPKYSVKRTLETLKEKGKLVIWDLDDDFWNLPNWSPYKQIENSLWMLDEALGLADWITVTTHPLLESIAMPHKTRVLPNLVDAGVWFNGWVRTQDVPIRVGWAGSVCHSADIELLVKPIEKLIKKYGKMFQFVFFGDLPEKLARYNRLSGTIVGKVFSNNSQVEFIEPTELPSYPKMLSSLRLDIGLCPLTWDKFNESKSNLKFLEYTMAGAVSIVSGGPAYSDTECAAYYIENPYNVEEWVGAIEAMIPSQKRERILADANTFVMNHFTWQEASNKWKVILDEIINT